MVARRILLIVCIFLISACAARAAGETTVLVTLDGISLDELVQWNIPEFRELANSGALGVMNDKTALTQNFEDSAITIGAGTRGMGYERRSVDSFSRHAANASEPIDGETAAAVYRRNTGFDAGASSVVQTRIAGIVSANESLGYRIIPGLLGDMLGGDGVLVAVYGNSDEGSMPARNAVMIAMDSRGLVPTGDVSAKCLTSDPSRPFGVRMDYRYIRECVRSLAGRRRFVVVEAGDAGRAEAVTANAFPVRAAEFKRLAAVECFRFLSDLNRDLISDGRRYLLILAVPSPSPARLAKGDRLTPVMLVGTGVKPGIVACGTTKRLGIVTSIDITATVTDFFRIGKHVSMLGMPIYSVPNSYSIAAVQATNHQAVTIYNARRPVIMGYIAYLIATVSLLILALLLHGVRSPVLLAFSRSPRVRFLATVPLLAPGLLLVAPVFGVYDTAPTALFLVASALGLAWILNRLIRDFRLLFGTIGLATSAIVTADMFSGSWMSMHSVFGYDPIIGIRFYGTGNETVGVLMGATILGVFSLIDRVKRLGVVQFLVPAAVFAALVYLVGAPSFGTNFGGMLALLAGFGYASLRACNPRSMGKVLIVIVVGMAVLFALVVLVNMRLDPAHQTHIGRAFAQTREDGITVLTDLAIRKWAMNLRLVKYSAWTYVLLCIIVSLIVLLVRPVGVLKRALSKHPAINAGLAGLMTGIVVAILANDSGIVMAATAALYACPPLMYMVRVELESTQHASS